MKYYQYKHDYKNIPNCKNNLKKALKRIGELDPFSVKRTTLSRHKQVANTLTDKQLFNRGVLNVRLALNRNLGKSGKYSNRMIKMCATVKTEELADYSYYLSAKLPQMDYIKIVQTTYTILWQFDRPFCEQLFSIEKSDSYPFKDRYKNPVFKSTAPIQTNLIIRSTGRTQQSQKFISFVKENLDRGN